MTAETSKFAMTKQSAEIHAVTATETNLFVLLNLMYKGMI